MHIIGETGDMVDLGKCESLVIVEPAPGKEETTDHRVVALAFESAPLGQPRKYLLLSCGTMDTASELIDAIGDALSRGVIVFSVTDWLDAKIEAQMAPAQPVGDLELEKHTETLRRAAIAEMQEELKRGGPVVL